MTVVPNYSVFVESVAEGFKVKYLPTNQEVFLDKCYFIDVLQAKYLNEFESAFKRAFPGVEEVIMTETTLKDINDLMEFIRIDS